MKSIETNAADRPGRSLASILVEPFKQFRFGVYVLGLSVLFVGVTGYLVTEAFKEQYQHLLGIFSVLDPKMQNDLIANEVFYSNALKIGSVFVAFISVLFAVVIRLTHRYYGPLVSINRFIGAIKRGEYDKRCRIRTKDELQDLVAHLNEMAAALEERHGSSAREPAPRQKSAG